MRQNPTRPVSAAVTRHRGDLSCRESTSRTRYTGRRTPGSCPSCPHWAEFEPERIRGPARAGGETTHTTWSVRVCGDWRMAFRFEDRETVDVNLIDYH